MAAIKQKTRRFDASRPPPPLPCIVVYLFIYLFIFIFQRVQTICLIQDATLLKPAVDAAKMRFFHFAAKLV